LSQFLEMKVILSSRGDLILGAVHLVEGILRERTLSLAATGAPRVVVAAAEGLRGKPA
jgi:hypothetical protein